MGDDDGGAVVGWEAIEAALKTFHAAMADACETRAGDPLLGSAKAAMACVELIEALPPMWNAGHAAPLYELALALYERHRTGKATPSRVLDPPPDFNAKGARQHAEPAAPPAAREVVMGMVMTGVRALIEPGPGRHTLDEACRLTDGCVAPYRDIIRPSGRGYSGPGTIKKWWNQGFGGQGPSSKSEEIRFRMFVGLYDKNFPGADTKEARARAAEAALIGSLRVLFGPAPLPDRAE